MILFDEPIRLILAIVILAVIGGFIGYMAWSFRYLTPRQRWEQRDNLRRARLAKERRQRVKEWRDGLR